MDGAISAARPFSQARDYGGQRGDAQLLLFRDRRREWLYQASLGATFRNLTYRGFAPLVRLRYERNVSTIGLYDYRRVAADWGGAGVSEGNGDSRPTGGSGCRSSTSGTSVRFRPIADVRPIDHHSSMNDEANMPRSTPRRMAIGLQKPGKKRGKIPLLSGVFALTVAAAGAAQTAGEPPGWIYRDASHEQIRAAEAVLFSRDRLARLVIRCDVTGDRTLSIQYKPDDDIGLSMAPIILDWAPSKGRPLSSNVVWEPDRKGAFARDGIDDRNASDIATAIETYPGTLKITATAREGSPVETLYDNSSNRDVIGRVLAQCPWNPHPEPTT